MSGTTSGAKSNSTNKTNIIVAVIALISAVSVAIITCNSNIISSKGKTGNTKNKISGWVFDADNHGIALANLSIIGRIEKGVANTDGSFTIQLIDTSEGYVKLHVEADGYNAYTGDQPVNQTLQIKLVKK